MVNVLVILSDRMAEVHVVERTSFTRHQLAVPSDEACVGGAEADLVIR